MAIRPAFRRWIGIDGSQPLRLPHAAMIFFLILLVLMFSGLVAEHFVGPLPVIGARVLFMHIVMFYGALALPISGMLALAFVGGLMWDGLHTQIVTNSLNIGGPEIDEGSIEIAMGWSIVLYAALGAIMNGLRPMFRRGRWELHCLLIGICVAGVVLAEYLMITLRREPVRLVFDEEIWWRIGGAGIVAAFVAPFVFFLLNYVAALVGYDPQPERRIR